MSMMWTLETALPVLQAVERICADRGAHCALGGSVLHKGGSEKDLDVFIYPHNKQGYEKDSLLTAFSKLLKWSGETQLHFQYDDKDVVQFFLKDKRIDVFFL